MHKIINSRKGMALSQIFILVISIVAFSYFVGSEFRIVSASVGDPSGGSSGECNKQAKTFEYDGSTYTILSPTRVSGIGCKIGEGCSTHIFILGSDGIWRWEDDSSISVSKNSEPAFYNSASECIDEVYGGDTELSNTECSARCNSLYGKSGACTESSLITCQDEGKIKSGECSNGGECCCSSSTTTGTTCNEICKQRGFNGGGGCQTPTSCTDSFEEAIGPIGGCTPSGTLTCCCVSTTSTEDEQDGTTDTPNPTGALTTGAGLLSRIPSEEEELTDEALQSLKDAYDDYNSCVEARVAEAHCRQAFPDGESDRLKAPFGWESGAGRFFGHLLQGLIWAGAIAGTLQAMRAFLPERAAPYLNALTWALAGGVLTGKLFIGAFDGLFGASKRRSIIAGVSAGVVTAAIIFFAVFRKPSQETIIFTCSPWDAPTGGQNCEECNKQEGALPCSEYQCRSLGQACELVNQGTEKERCVWVNRGDVEFPTIEPLENALLNDYEYTPDNTISPPDRGVAIEYTGDEDTTTMDIGGDVINCVPAFTPLSFGVTLNEPAKCKLDVLRKEKYEDMDFFFSKGLLLYNHSYSLSLPGSSALEAEGIEIQNDGEYSVYVRCQDANGNSNTANFVFNFCVDKSPDTTAPVIVDTNPLNGRPFAYGQTSIDSTIYLNEPVTNCKWSHTNQDYSNMENDFDCSNANTINTQGDYNCGATLDGLKDREENKFYFRCEDLSGNINQESYEYTLIGTQPLVIDTIKPETGDLIKDATETVKVTLEVETSAGYNEGESDCYYSDTGDESNYVMFFNTGSYQHSQDLWLASGNYDYFIKCIDLGGNSDNVTINFDVESDASAPIIVRAYHEENYIKLITSEPARCVYDTTYENYPCDYLFEDGTLMSTTDDTDHYATWNTQTTFYVKCEDEYGTQPNPDECSIIVRPSDLS